MRAPCNCSGGNCTCSVPAAASVDVDAVHVLQQLPPATEGVTDGTVAAAVFPPFAPGGCACDDDDVICGLSFSVCVSDVIPDADDDCCCPLSTRGLDSNPFDALRRWNRPRAGPFIFPARTPQWHSDRR